MNRDEEAWFKSVEHDAWCIVTNVIEEADDLVSAMSATERALAASREHLRGRLIRERSELREKLKMRLEGLGFGPFVSDSQLENFIEETRAEACRSDGGEMSPREEIYWEWERFEHELGWKHKVELSDRPTLFTRYGTIIALHALLESALQAFCSLAQKRRRSSLAVEDLAKGGVEGFKERRYLEKVHSVVVSKDLWDALTPLVFVRNRIAHSSGRIHGYKSPREMSLLTTTPGLKVAGHLVSFPVKATVHN